MRSFVVGVALAAVFGCGPGRAAVEGVVRLDGKPLADAEVQFIPDVTRGTDGPPASAYTDRDGRYRIVATGTGGVVVGACRVRVNDATVMMPGGGADPESGEPAAGAARPPRRSRVPAVYGDALRSPLGAIDITPGEQIHNFDLKSNP